MERPAIQMPALDLVQATVTALQEQRLIVALGGSGLLAALGLTRRVRDWDLTTDAEPPAVERALRAGRLEYSMVSAGDGVFATRSRYRIDADDHEVDLLVGFALRTSDGTVAIPTRVSGSWRGLPLADPAAWALAYELMGRHESAGLLRSRLNSSN
jgi:hypothetical protein